MPTEAIRKASLPQWMKLGLLALGYFAAAKASLVFAIPPGYATAVWPPSGLALAALLLWGPRAWPGVWLGAALTNYSIDLSMPAALGIATGNTLEGLCAAWLASRWTERHAEFLRPESVFFFTLAAALASAVAAGAGVSSLYLAGMVDAGDAAANAYTWWQGDFSGMLLVAPCVLAWAREGDAVPSRAHAAELVLFSALLAATLYVLFGGDAADYDSAPLVFLAIPFFVWAACRFSERAVTLIVLLANGWAIACTANGLGPFLSESLNRDLLTLQAFTSTGALVSLVLWALLRRRADEATELRASRDELGQHLWSRTRGLREQVAEGKEALSLARAGAWRWDGRSESVEWSDEVCRLLGLGAGGLKGGFEAYYDRLHVGDIDRVRAALKDAYVNHLSWDRRERIVRADGEQRLLRSVGRSSPPRAGGAARMHGVLIDITEYAESAGAPPAGAAAEAVAALGLPEALRARAAHFEIRTGIGVEVTGPSGGVALEPSTALALYRIAEEALENAARHAHARRVDMELDYEDGLATLTVRDDGSGFAQDWQAKGGDGIRRMRERASSVGGRVWIESSPGAGAILRVTARG